MTERAEHIPIAPPEPAYGWCAPCQHCHEAPFCEPQDDEQEQAA